MKRIVSLMLVVLLVCSLTACGNNTGTTSTDSNSVSATSAVSSDYDSFSLDVVGTEVTYTKVPEKVIAINYECAQELVALGLKDRIIGITAGHFKIEECLPEYQDDLADLKDLGSNISYETILAENPDFVYGHSWIFNAESTAAPEEYINDGIAFMLLREIPNLLERLNTIMMT